MVQKSKLGVSAVMLFVAIVSILAAGTASWLWQTSGQRSPEPPQPALPRLTEFQLTGADGEEFRSEQLGGKVWVASYFFAQCGGNCRMLNMELVRLQREYGPLGLHFVSMTCDPKNDSPQVLDNYADLLNADQRSWAFLTGEMDYLKRIGSDLVELPVSERAHHTQISVVDRTGTPRGTFDVVIPRDLKRAKKLIEELLADPTSGDKPQVARAPRGE